MKTALRRLLPLLALVVSVGLPAQETPPPPPPPPQPVNHDFDFWLGEWDVFQNGTETKIGDSRIEAVSGGHALLEHWRATTSAHEGKSLNSHDPHSGQWRQYWVANNGQTSLYVGGMVDGRMVMVAEQRNARGARYLMRGTWTPHADGTVRQLFEVSTDEGATWKAVFDGLYRRKATAPAG